MKKTLLSIIAGASLVLAGCGSTNNVVLPTAPAQAQVGITYTQVEFLARPGIGEALLFTNSNLNTYNAVTPSFVNAALTNPAGPEAAAANAVLTEAQAVLNILTGLSANGPTTTEVVQRFLPDVMRIDTTQNFQPGTPAYAGAANANNVLTGGRKLTDDVVDITLQALTGIPTLTDNVPYYGTGITNPNVGHSRLNGQTVDFGPATWPYLADPN